MTQLSSYTFDQLLDGLVEAAISATEADRMSDTRQYLTSVQALKEEIQTRYDRAVAAEILIPRGLTNCIKCGSALNEEAQKHGAVACGLCLMEPEEEWER